MDNGARRPPSELPPAVTKRGVEVSNKLDKDGTLIKGTTTTIGVGSLQLRADGFPSLRLYFFLRAVVGAERSEPDLYEK